MRLDVGTDRRLWLCRTGTQFEKYKTIFKQTLHDIVNSPGKPLSISKNCYFAALFKMQASFPLSAKD